MQATPLEQVLKAHAGQFHSVVPFEKSDKLLLLDFTEHNTELTDEILGNTNQFIQYINGQLAAANARYGIGGYGEHRTVYRYSKVFDAKEGEEPRRLHLGLDIWGKLHTKIMAPLDGIVHSFAFNNAYGDYGATIILAHNLDGLTFYTLYGHLNLQSLTNLHEGYTIRKGDTFCDFGAPSENGQWPPHLHFQVISDLQGMKGDYPGVCALSQKEFYLANCPDPDLILGMMQYAVQG
jgi:murein DD-endopeptidase MepM/ murein hydrolase activator NlpD